MVSRISTSPYWETDDRFTLRFEIDAPVTLSIFETFNSNWSAPCHALIDFSGLNVATISGILTFDDWRAEDQYAMAFSTSDFDEPPHLAALSSSIDIDLDQSQNALEAAFELIHGVSPNDDRVLVDLLETTDDGE